MLKSREKKNNRKITVYEKKKKKVSKGKKENIKNKISKKIKKIKKNNKLTECPPHDPEMYEQEAALAEARGKKKKEK